jgi:tRNA (adenine57-N1/adenine58-N1)-methyltransferase catalytic subunit
LSWNTQGTTAREGDLVELVGTGHRHFIVTLKSGDEFQSHRGVLKHDDLIGLPWGSQIRSHNGSPFFLLQPSLVDLLKEIKRNTQIIYPKEIGYILLRLGIGEGSRVGESGTGSGALTTALAFAVGSAGKVYTYEAKLENMNLARKNLTKVGLDSRVEFNQGDMQDGFKEKDLDAVFLDMNNSYDYMRQVRESLKPGGFFGTLLPTTNQVCRMIESLRHEKFAFIDVVEISMRFYKAESDRFRPVDRMVAHTGFLIFARPIITASDDQDVIDLVKETERDSDQ